MKRRGKVLGLSALALAFALSSCAKGPLGGAKESDGDSDGDTVGDGTANVSMQGTLALSTEPEVSASLVDEAYNLYCVTFTDVPLACKVDVGTDGAFNKQCADFASKAFGCFLRQGNKTLATIEFDLGAALTVGGGSLVFNVSFDPETGLAFAKVDSAASTSLSGGKPAGEATSIALDGTWKIGCADAGDAEIGSCPPDMGDGFNLSFSTFKVGEDNKLAMWKSDIRRDVCMNGGKGTQALPDFRINFGGKEFALDYSDKAKFEASVDILFAGLDKDVKDEIVKFSKARGHYDHCSTTLDADNCRRFVPEMVKIEVADTNAPGGFRDEFRPKDYSAADFDSLTDYAGTAIAGQWKCALDPTKAVQGTATSPGIPPCQGKPPVDFGDGTGGGTFYSSAEGQPLQLLCKSGDSLMHFPVMAATKEAAMKAATSATGGGDCAKVDLAGVKYPRAQVEEIRRATYELFRVEQRGGPNDDGDPTKVCEESDIPDNFTFESCKSNGDREICWMKDQLPQMGFKLGAKLSATSGPAMIDIRIGDILCPLAFAANKTSLSQDQNSFSNACRAEVVGLKSLGEQLRRIMKGRSLYKPMSQAVICGRKAGNPLRTKLIETLKNSCVAEVEYQKTCFEGGICETSMVCRGSSNNGKCLSDDGTLFTGRVNGRDELLDLKLLTGGAFAMSNSSLEKYQRFDQKANKPIACTFAKQFIINARKVDDNNFTGVVSEAGKQSCESSSDEGGGGEGGGGGDDKDGGGGDKGSMTIPIKAVRQ